LAKKQGGLANSSGNTLEKMVIATFESKGFEVEMYRQWMKKPEKYGNELLLRNVPYETIYGHNGNTEFLIKSQIYNLEIRIECKWQQSSGSVDEKFPYLYLNCIEKMPESKIIIIVDGGGAKLGAVEWLKSAANSSKYWKHDKPQKEILVMDLQGFIIWANNTFR
jgi:hypothetical protein